MKEFHIDEPREIGRKKQRLSRSDILNIKDELTEVVVRKKIREFIKKEFMEKVIVINSTLGCGKSSVSEALSDKIVGSVIVEGDDYNRLVKNFSVYDESKILESIKLIVSRVNDLIEAGNSTIIVDYVFEQPHHLNFLKFHLENSINVYPFYLSANREVIKSRIIDRKRKSLFEALRRNWELKRFKEILDIQEEYIDSGDLGKVINANKKINEVVKIIREELKKEALGPSDEKTVFLMLKIYGQSWGVNFGNILKGINRGKIGMIKKGLKEITILHNKIEKEIEKII